MMRIPTLLLAIFIGSFNAIGASSVDDLEPSSPNDVPLTGLTPNMRPGQVGLEVDAVNYMPPLAAPEQSPDLKPESSLAADIVTMPVAQKSSVPMTTAIALAIAMTGVVCYRKFSAKQQPARAKAR